MAEDRHHDVVVPPFKTLAVLDTGSFVIRVTHGEKYRRFAHAPVNFACSHQVLFIGGEFFKDVWIALDAALRSARTAAK